MLINGIDTAALGPMAPPDIYPDTQPGLVLHIDADFLAYMTSWEPKDEDKSFDDMKKNCASMIEMFRRKAGAERVYLHLTPGTSDKGSRYEIAIQKEYQGNRTDDNKPAKLHLMRQWMGNNYAATLHQQCEADDGMSSEQYADPENSMIVSKDKDLLMVPGRHMDWDSHDIFETGNHGDYGYIYIDDSKTTKKIKGVGQKFFWGQMLTGDQADTIAGLPKVKYDGKWKAVGPVMADYILTNVNSNAEAFYMVKGLYERYGTEIGFKHWRTGEAVSWQQVFVSEAQLLWMRREKHNPQCVLKWFKEIMQ